MDIAEKRVYDDTGKAALVAVGSETGLVIARVSGAIVGEFGLGFQTAVRDLAVLADGGLAVATDNSVVIVDPPAQNEAPGSVKTRTKLPGVAATAVTAVDDRIIAVTSEAVIACPPPYEEQSWTQIGSNKAVAAADGRLLGTDNGVFRITETGMTPAGLGNITAVAAGDPILAGTEDGLYRLANGWVQDQAGPVGALASFDGGALGVVDDELLVWTDGGWTPARWDRATAPVVVAVGTNRYALTETGALAVADDGDWRSRTIGAQAVSCCVQWQ